MTRMKDAAQDFLAQKRIAVAGVSRDSKQPANLIFRTLRETGHEVFAVNPNAEEVEGATCYHDLKSIPGGVDAVMVATPPAATLSVVSECADLHVPRVWLHR
jgi:predicted CoA-binding protein